MGVLESCGRGERGVGWVVRVQDLDRGSGCGAGTGCRGREPGGIGVWGRNWSPEVQGQDPGIWASVCRVGIREPGFKARTRCSRCGLGSGAGIGVLGSGVQS